MESTKDEFAIAFLKYRDKSFVKTGGFYYPRGTNGHKYPMTINELLDRFKKEKCNG